MASAACAKSGTVGDYGRRGHRLRFDQREDFVVERALGPEVLGAYNDQHSVRLNVGLRETRQSKPQQSVLPNRQPSCTFCERRGASSYIFLIFPLVNTGSQIPAISRPASKPSRRGPSPACARRVDAPGVRLRPLYENAAQSSPTKRSLLDPLAKRTSNLCVTL
jgi:hypothetical protein